MAAQTRKEWLQERRLGLGASDTAAIVGVSPWTTSWQVWLDKTGAVPLEGEENDAMRWGSRLESMILDDYGMVNDRGSMVWHDSEPWFATLDGIYEDAEAGGVFWPVEAKTTSAYSWDEVPLQYVAQAQWQMMVTGYKQVDFAVLHKPNLAFRVYTVTADPDDQKALGDAAREWWQKHIIDGEEPDALADDLERLNNRWQPKEVFDQEVDGVLFESLRELRAEEQQIAARRKEVEALIKQQMGGATTATVDGEVVATWNATKGRTRFDAKRFKEDHPEVHADYLITGEPGRRFTLKETN